MRTPRQLNENSWQKRQIIHKVIPIRLPAESQKEEYMPKNHDTVSPGLEGNTCQTISVS